jgi:1-acyl-sn-glycerol-3-phosphate acyltransferase
LRLSASHRISEAAIRSAIFPLVRGLWKSTTIRGRELLLRGPCFLYGNHSNNLDPFLVNWDLPFGRCSSGVLTAEYMQGGPISAALKGIGLLSTRKRVPEPHLIRKIYGLLNDGRNVLIYPEGGRRWHGRPVRWIESTAKLFSRASVPVHPVVTHGSYVAWPRWADWPRPARIQVEVLDAVDFSSTESTDERVERLAKPISGDENLPLQAVRPTWAFRPADGIHRLLYRDPITGDNAGVYTPDGERIHNRAGTMRWRMLPDSRILDERTGDVLLTGDLYASIRDMPLQPGPMGHIVRNLVEYSEGPDLRTRRPCGQAYLSLFRDHVTIETGVGQESIDLSEILYQGVERNSKLQLTLANRILEFRFAADGSALQWEDAVFALRNGGSD